MIDRRGFLDRLWKPAKRRHLSPVDREARVRELEALVRTLPGDFDLTEKEKEQIMSRVRSYLAELSDTQLSAASVITQIDAQVRDIVAPWREALEAQLAAKGGVYPVRQAARDYVDLFLSEASGETIERLMIRLEAPERGDLSRRLKDEIDDWTGRMDDAALARYDSTSIREPVFARLRGWC